MKNTDMEQITSDLNRIYCALRDNHLRPKTHNDRAVAYNFVRNSGLVITRDHLIAARADCQRASYQLDNTEFLNEGEALELSFRTSIVNAVRRTLHKGSAKSKGSEEHEDSADVITTKPTGLEVDLTQWPDACIPLMKPAGDKEQTAESELYQLVCQGMENQTNSLDCQALPVALA